MDWPAWLERRVGAARGATGGEAAAWLRETNFSAALGWLAAGLVGLGIVVHLTREWWRTEIKKIAVEEPSAGWRGSVVAWLGVGAVWLWYWPTLGQGFFRYDDFELLAVARERSLGEAWWLPHGDHFMPLTRVLAWIGYQSVGVTAWPYNAMVLLAMCAVVGLGCTVLSELKVSRAGQAVFVVLCVCWSPWAEVMTGYYVLSTYLMIAALGLAAVWNYLRWAREPRLGRAVGMSLAAGLATLIDVSGWYVPAACLVFLAANWVGRESSETAKTWWRRHRGLCFGLGVGLAVCLAATIYAYAVLHRGVFLSMSGEGGGRSLGRLVLELGYLFNAGLLGSLVTPFVYARLPGLVLGAICAGALGAFVIFSVTAVRAAGRERRVMLGAVALVVAGTSLMVVLGRPSEDTIVVRWAAKHICPAYIWLCVLLAASWDGVARKLAAASCGRWVDGTLVMLISFVGGQTALGCLGMAVEFPPFGYPAELRDAGRRRAAVERLRREVVEPLAAAVTDREKTITAPVLDGAWIGARIPSLFEYNLSHYAPFFGAPETRVRWVRNPAMQPWRTRAVETVPDLRAAVSPEFKALLGQRKELRDFYFAAAVLRTGADGEKNGVAPSRRAGREIESGQPLVVRAEAWAPETAYRLVLDIERLGGGGGREIAVDLSFSGDAAGASEPWRGKFVVRLARQGGAAVVVVDLRQVYAFSLSQQVKALTVLFPEAGRYRVRRAELSAELAGGSR
jgi:hypothetical protein